MTMRSLVLPLLALALVPDVHAGECRARLRPLLLETAPDPAALAEVRRGCAAEVEAGDADSLYHLALFHLGLGGEWQPALAIPMIREAAASGVPEAQYWLAWQTEAGPLLPHDPAQALGWYERAADANHRLALARLAQAWEAGELGLPRDPRRAAEYRARQARCEADGEQPGT
jgi:TPR repeat protein